MNLFWIYCETLKMSGRHIICGAGKQAKKVSNWSLDRKTDSRQVPWKHDKKSILIKHFNLFITTWRRFNGTYSYN